MAKQTKQSRSKPKPPAKGSAQASGKSSASALAKPTAKPRVAWTAVLRTGQVGVRRWNKLTVEERSRIRLAKADFSNCDLTGANFTNANLRGVNFRGAKFDGVKFGAAQIDDATTWPDDVAIPASIVWAGRGPDPRKVASMVEQSLPKPADFSEFLERLKKVADAAKIDKATSMLKAERFRLFAKVGPDEVVGVVKSQSDPSLVYSCRLGRDGNYACCTQNLFICGGLRGSPCKHLLVLILGLSKAGELEPATAHEWTQASRGRKPELDKEQMTATFLQYKGAEAGEIDWRPTETVPEDFYAM